MDSTLIFIFGTLINVVIVGAGAGAVFFTIKNSRNTAVLALKDDTIKAMETRIKSLEDQLVDVRVENTRLKALVDDLVAMEDSRKRNQSTRKTTTTQVHVVKKEE